MQCGAEERIVRNVRIVVVRCFKCGKEGHKCKECVRGTLGEAPSHTAV